MASYNYIDNINNNLMCAICRMPFTDPTSTRSCSHTFCHDCIVRAISHVTQCPVDRSPLSLQDLIPADPIVRHLVDELVVECAQRSEGCTYTCQRQLMASHLKETCQYVHVPCSQAGCEEFVLRKDVGKHTETCANRLTTCEGCGDKLKESDLVAHESHCSTKTIVCEFCSDELPRSKLVEHNNSCPSYAIPCTHASNGCPWTGPRNTLASSHIPSCPYESIKGFFSVQKTAMVAVTEENAVLKVKVDVLEGMVQTMRREMQSIKASLGPWYRPDETHSPLPRQVSSPNQGYSNPSRPRPTSLGSSPGAHASNLFVPFGSPPANDALAPYFPPEAEESLPWLEQRLNHLSSPTADINGRQYHESIPLTPIAPINLSTTLEGSLGSLRESVVTLSASVDSLARRHDIELRNETLRMNEEISRLSYTMNGLRMQVHNIMMDRNAQVTGRMSDNSPAWGGGEGEAGPPTMPFGFFQPRPPSFSTATKL